MQRGAVGRLLGQALVLAASLVASQDNFDPNRARPQSWDGARIGTNKTTNATFSNPVMTVNMGDPFMTRYRCGGEDWYLLTYTTNDNITLKRSRSLTDNWDSAETRTVFKPDPGSAEPWSTSLWAPEVHKLSGRWYIIFTATPDGDNPAPLLEARCTFNCPAINHRMFVLEADGPDPWTAEFRLKSMLDSYDQFAIDGTYLVHGPDLYHVYSCWENKYSAWPANLCITRMSDPWTVASAEHQRRTISVPDEAWEKTPYGRSDSARLASNEGPQQLVNPSTGQHFIVYSAGRVNTPFYCLGLLELVGPDPMQAQAWRKHRAGCLFHQNTAAAVYGPGHASFTTSPDGAEHYLVYHAQTTDYPSAQLYRTARVQKFDWNPDGTPRFPAAENGPFPVPAGQRALSG